MHFKFFSKKKKLVNNNKKTLKNGNCPNPKL